MVTEAARVARFAPDDLLSYACGVLEALGIPPADASEVAACLLETNLGGVASQGLVRLPVYGRGILSAVVNAAPSIRIQSPLPATASVDGDNGRGPVGRISTVRAKGS